MLSPGILWCARNGIQSFHHVSGAVFGGYHALMFESQLNAVLKASVALRCGKSIRHTSNLTGTVASSSTPFLSSPISLRVPSSEVGEKEADKGGDDDDDDEEEEAVTVKVPL